MKTLPQLQLEIAMWADANFGQNFSKDQQAVHHTRPLGSIPPFFGMVEELGELARVFGRCAQGRSEHGSYEAVKEAKEDALADLLIFMCDLASRENIDLLTVLNATWERVCKRRQSTWHQDKAKEAQAPAASQNPTMWDEENAVKEQTGQGFAEPKEGT